MFSRFFVRRPVFAWVIAILIMLAGMLAIRTLPVAQYPDVAPPSIKISATYTGASAQTLENSVTQVIEQQLTGLDNLLYWEEADAWYATHTDTGLNTVTLTGGERTDDGLLKLYYSGGYITLRPTQDGQSPQPYFIVSNQPES